MSKTGYFLRACIGFILVLVIWELCTRLFAISPIILPPPAAVFGKYATLLTSPTFLWDILISIFRIACGFIASAIISIPGGILLASTKKLEPYVDPLISFIRYIPPSAFIPLSILWFGTTEVQKSFIVFISVAPYLILLVADCVSQVKQEYIDAGHTLGASRRDTYLKVILPASMPGIWESMRLMIGAAWTFIILAEIVAANTGLGHVIMQGQRFLQTPTVIAVVIFIGVLGLVTDYFFRFISLRFFPWVERL